MALWTQLAGGLRALFRKSETEQEMADELQAFLEASAERKRRSGMSAAEAWRCARAEMGSVEYVKEEIRGAGWESAVASLWSDVRYAFRVLGRARGFTIVVVLTLALGIGANTAVFSLINALLLKSLPVRNPQELVEVSHTLFTNPLWEQVRDRQDVFSGVFAWSSDRFNLAQGGRTDYADGLWASGDFFRTLGLRPAAGRLLSPSDDRPGCPARAVLGYGFWQSRYGGQAGVVGGTISLSGHPFEVIGVTPAGFFGMEVGTKFDIAIPLCTATILDGPDSRLEKRSWWWLSIVGRLKPGLGIAQAKARLAALSPFVFGAAVPQNVDTRSQDNFRKRTLRPVPAAVGLSYLRDEYEQPLRVLMAVVGLVLLIACANIAGLMLARAAARGKEMALRQALGASRFRLIRQLLTECLLLSVAGALAGLLFATWGDRLLLHFLSTLQDQVFLDFAPDGRVLAFTVAVAVLTGLSFGMAPAFRGTRASLSVAIKESAASDRGRGRLHLWIVAAQVALSLVLLVMAGLLLRSFRNLTHQDIGFDRDNVLVVSIGLGHSRQPHAEDEATYNRIQTALRSLPGVISAARSKFTPVSRASWNTNVQSDAPNAPAGDASLAYFNFVDPAYFETLRSELLAGRNFSRGDTSTSTAVAVINETVAKKFFPGLNPLGRTFRVEGEARRLEPPVEVVGVIKDAKYSSIREETYPTIFRPIAQLAEIGADNVELRTNLPAAALTPAVVKSVAAIDPRISLDVYTLAAQVDDSLTTDRVLAALSAFFGALALLLAMVGLYGTLSYLVAQRRIEFGIRTALGAPRAAILRLVLRDAAQLLLAGTAAGIALALVATRLLDSQLFGLQSHDPATLLASAALLAAVSLAASYRAARRSVEGDPMAALRHD